MLFSKPKQSEQPFFVWSDQEFSVGVPAFDQEHKRLADLLNHIHTAMVVRRDRDAAMQYFDRFIMETRQHFHREELALTAASYPECEAHFEEHSTLLREAEELRRSYLSGAISLLALPTFLKTWLISHIQGSDRKYAACLRRAGRV